MERFTGFVWVVGIKISGVPCMEPTGLAGAFWPAIDAILSCGELGNVNDPGKEKLNTFGNELGLKLVRSDASTLIKPLPPFPPFITPDPPVTLKVGEPDIVLAIN